MKLTQHIEETVKEILKEEGEVSTFSFARRITGLIDSTRTLLKQMEDDNLIKEVKQDIWKLKEVKG